jgi:hypothetical protein
MADKKLCCDRSTRPKAVLAVGLRQKTLRPRFLIATTASKVFQQPISAHQCPLVVKNLIREISVNPRKSAV